ncbi:MAG: glycosyltransferase [Elusimicrobia bacterium]|nr:glycosyltransferase [Elusimicrobiota bacterium]
MTAPTSAPARAELGAPRAVLDAAAVILASRPESLARCLESLARQEGAAPFETVLVLNGRQDACAAVARRFQGRLPGLAILPAGGLSLGEGRNRAVRLARSRWLAFFDDDVALPPGYFSLLARTLDRHPDAAAVGGPDRTPAGSALFQRCVGHVLDSALGSGPIRRHGRGFPCETWTDDRGLILCNLVFDRRALEASGLGFDETLVRNEENLLLAQLLARGRRALHAPGLFVFHERRPGLAGFARQCFLSGWGRAQMSLKRPGSLRLFHLGPLIPAACLLAVPRVPEAALLALAAYAAASAANGLSVLARQQEEPGSALTWLTILAPIAHLCYAAGLAAGTLDCLAFRSRRRGART